MKKTTLGLVASLIACSTLFSTGSWAEGPGNQHGQPWQQQGGNDRQQAHGQGSGDRGQGNDSHRGNAQAYRSSSRDHFAWNGHDFRRGHTAPQEFRSDRYRVNDWRERGLHEPPRGEYWSNIDGNYVLIAAATGVITSIILNSAVNH